MLPTKFQVNWPFGSGEEEKNRFSRCQLEFQIGTILAIFDLPDTPMLPFTFRVIWPFGSGEVQNRLSGWSPSCISDRNDFSYFYL